MRRPRLPLDYFTPAFANDNDEKKKLALSLKRKRGPDPDGHEEENVHDQEEPSENGLPQSSGLTGSVPIHEGSSPPRHHPRPDHTSQGVTEDNEDSDNRDDEATASRHLPHDQRRQNLGKRPFGPRKQHFAVLTTILHRCLLQRDYKRASRAWGMVLRSQHGGKGLSLRQRNNWGIGAEMLLHREVKTPDLNAEGDEVDLDLPVNMSTATEETSFPFPLENFDLVKEYYDRLILHYPFSKHFPNHVSDLQFYPALFTLWIASIQERMLRAEQVALCTDMRPPARGPAAALVYTLKGTVERPLATEEMFPIPRIQALRQAQELADEIEGLIVAPPYSDSLQILQLKAMLHVWTADVIYQIWVLLTLFPDSLSQDDRDDVARCATFWTDLTARDGPSQVRKKELDEAKKVFAKLKEDHDVVIASFESFLRNSPEPKVGATLKT